MGERINSYKELRVFQNAMNAAMKIFELTKTFPGGVDIWKTKSAMSWMRTMIKSWGRL